jgi:hypothetical protein
MTSPIESGPRDAFRDDEMRWRAYLVLAQLMHCRAVAQLSAAERGELEILGGLPLADSAETGQALVGLTGTEVAALADRIENPWDHAAIRGAIEAFRHEGPTGAESRALRAALLRRARHDLNGSSG